MAHEANCRVLLRMDLLSNPASEFSVRGVFQDLYMYGGSPVSLRPGRCFERLGVLPKAFLYGNQAVTAIHHARQQHATRSERRREVGQVGSLKEAGDDGVRRHVTKTVLEDSAVGHEPAPSGHR